MSERKYTDEEIVKALECFSVGVGCKGCPFIDQGCFDCGNIPTEFSESVLALINRQKAEIAVLTTAVDNSTKEFLKLHDEYQDQNAEIEKLQEVNADLNESLRLAAEANKDLKAEIERLTKERDAMRSTAYLLKKHYEWAVKAQETSVKAFSEFIHAVRSDAINEFAERLKANMCHGYPYLEIEEDLFRRDVDNLVAEMTEGE